MEQNARLRLRLIFKDCGVLNKFQKKNGLKKCWVLLKPHFNAISDVVSHIFHIFKLHHSCPHGILLSMDGFVLPPFESIAILKDQDLICVRRKKTKLHDVIRAIEGEKPSIENEIVEKQPLPSGLMLLANEEYDKETGGYESEADEVEDEAEENQLPLENVSCRDVTSKKRKASSKVEGSKTKRQRKIAPESVQKKQTPSCKHTPQKKSKHDNQNKGDSISKPKVSEKCTKDQEPTSDSEDESDECGERTTPVLKVCDGAKKVSRSTRRKRLQRKWRKIHRDKDKMDRSDSQEPVEDLNANSTSKKTSSANIIPHQQTAEESDADGDLVPVVIRPGHIRFTRSGQVSDVQQIQVTNSLDVPSTVKTVGEDHTLKRSGWDVSKETFQWNGITNKRKGQKWGREKQPTVPWRESRDDDASPSKPQQDYPSSHAGRLNGTFKWNKTINKTKGQKWGQEKQPSSSWKESRDYNAHSSGAWAAQKQLTEASVDFEKLPPLTDLPKVGDIVAYRLLELSSSWCPELSSFRIGKITRFEPESNRIMLVQDAEYPCNNEKKTHGEDDDASGQPPESSVYNEDGSLEIDFQSLVDVRVVKRGSPSLLGSETPVANDTLTPSGISKRVDETQDASKNVVSDVGNGELKTPAPVNGKKDVWEEISEALSAKKAQLSQEDNWNKKVNSAKRPWSRRTLRSGGLGPTMAMLRSQNGV